MSGEHYFTARPAGSEERQRVDVELAGRRVSVTTARGVFSPDHVDTGTQVLLREAPPPPTEGTLLDLGCGWGPVALSLALRSPDADVFAVDVNERALDLTRANAESLGLNRIRACLPTEVPAGLTFATIWSNPPIRVGKAVLHDLLWTWLPRLEAGADACLVVQRNLGADSLQRWVAEELRMPCERYAVAKGFRLLRVSRAA